MESLLAQDLDEFKDEVGPSVFHLMILGALNRTGKHIYGGTVPEAEVAKRRAKNKVARQSRRKNRK